METAEAVDLAAGVRREEESEIFLKEKRKGYMHSNITVYVSFCHNREKYSVSFF